ncbi:hypothetical protein MKW94_019916 [Papaver nudicaule]|uniref:O-fucosyltransferase family protein n=1 Tax=Papaver nudicaule TaxID=74823 RepID=A0AA41VU46_PAPNU|nr:hypothetical protein [Papaver nudicaule]
MAIDPRQVLGGILTFTMFAMLGNMVKRDHFDNPIISQVRITEFEAAVEFEKPEVTEQSKISVSSKGPWLEMGNELRQCWTRPDSIEHSKGFITFSLTNGPEYHVSQIADAVAIARYLGAKLVLPDIRGSKIGDARDFGEIYDVEKFVESLNGVVKVVKEKPSEISRFAVIRVPNMVTQDFIAENIKPLFKAKGNIRLATYFPSVDMKKKKERNELDSVSCLAMFGSLELQPEVREVVDSMVDKLRTLSRKSEGQFIAVDLRMEILEKTNCQGLSGEKSCFYPQDIGMFLRKIGFNADTTIYVTQRKWHKSLDGLKEIFPRTYTKDSIIPAEKKTKFLTSESLELEKAIDFHICSESDVFVPSISGLFYANVAGKRIASGKTQILVPTERDTSSPTTNFISSYISKKDHFVHSCYCEVGAR